MDPRLPAPGRRLVRLAGLHRSTALAPVSSTRPRAGSPRGTTSRKRTGRLAATASLWGAFQRVREPMSLIGAHRVASTLDDAWHVATPHRRARSARHARLQAIHHGARQAGGPDTARTRGGQGGRRAGTGPRSIRTAPSATAPGQPTGKVASPAFAIMDAWFAAIEREVASPAVRPGARRRRRLRPRGRGPKPDPDAGDDQPQVRVLRPIRRVRLQRADGTHARSRLPRRRSRLGCSLAALRDRRRPAERRTGQRPGCAGEPTCR